jgi:hypothetical protein
MHAELVEQDGRQQLRADEAARRGMERRGRLADPLAIAAGELFPHRLDDRGISSSAFAAAVQFAFELLDPQPRCAIGASLSDSSARA